MAGLKIKGSRWQQHRAHPANIAQSGAAFVFAWAAAARYFWPAGTDECVRPYVAIVIRWGNARFLYSAVAFAPAPVGMTTEKKRKSKSHRVHIWKRPPFAKSAKDGPPPIRPARPRADLFHKPDM
jgi:hypothetical protein